MTRRKPRFEDDEESLFDSYEDVEQALFDADEDEDSSPFHEDREELEKMIEEELGLSKSRKKRRK